MGSLQKKEMEMLCELKKKEVHVLQGYSRPTDKITAQGTGSHCRKGRDLSTCGLSQNMPTQSKGPIQGLPLSNEGCLKVLDSLNLEQMSPSIAHKHHSDLSNPCRFSLTEVSLENASTIDFYGETLNEGHEGAESGTMRHADSAAYVNKSTNVGKDESCKTVAILENVVVHSGNGYRSSKHDMVPSLLESIRKQDLSLSNLSLSEPISLTNFSGHGSLLDILNYFPPKSPAFCSRKKLLILDINGILADIVYPPPKGYKADTKIAGRAVFARPFCSDFLNFCLERFNVAIWSSRSRKIIDRLINYLMGDLKHRLIFCWDLSHCTGSNFRTLENKHKALVFKELRKVWETYEPDLPWEKGHFNESNTLLLDDTPYKALLNPPHTAIFPYSFEFKDQGDSAIGPGGRIRAYLEELAVADNVQKYVKEHPFGQSAITERSLTWQFYDKVIKGQSAEVPAGG